MPKNKPHKGLLKRMRITKTGKVSHKSAFGKHLRSSKSGKRRMRLRTTKFLAGSQAKPLEQLLHRRLRGRDQPRTALRRSPSPAQRRKMAAEKAAGEKKKD